MGGRPPDLVELPCEFCVDVRFKRHRQSPTNSSASQAHSGVVNRRTAAADHKTCRDRASLQLRTLAPHGAGTSGGQTREKGIKVSAQMIMPELERNVNAATMQSATQVILNFQAENFNLLRNLARLPALTAPQILDLVFHPNRDASKQYVRALFWSAAATHKELGPEAARR